MGWPYTFQVTMTQVWLHTLPQFWFSTPQLTGPDCQTRLGLCSSCKFHLIWRGAWSQHSHHPHLPHKAPKH
ncbi:unnamed protein product, partial [Gulo gulo]